MIKLYYINNNMALNVIDLPTFQTCIDIPEDLLFVAFRDGTQFIKEPSETYTFTDIERIIMSTEAFDLSFVKDSDFRRQNTKFCPKEIERPPAIEIGVFSTDNRDGIQKIWLHLPYTAQVIIYIGEKATDFGVKTAIPKDYGSATFDYSQYNNSHEFDITSIGGNVHDLSNILIQLTSDENETLEMFELSKNDNLLFVQKKF